MTYPLEPYIETEFFYKGERMMRKKKFRKFRQNVAGRTVYFKEFGDPRIMDKRTGKYVTEEDMEPVDIDDQANEMQTWQYALWRSAVDRTGTHC